MGPGQVWEEGTGWLPAFWELHGARGQGAQAHLTSLTTFGKVPRPPSCLESASAEALAGLSPLQTVHLSSSREGGRGPEREGGRDSAMDQPPHW